MYLIKGDEVKILDEKDDWLKIRYYAKTKTIDGWIMRSDVE
jgi:SH3-like domain-containing protein